MMLRHALAILILLLSSAFPGASSAQQAWLLLDGADQGDIYRAEEGDGLRHVARVGDGVTYGETASALAVLSRRTYADPLLLQIFDKKTEKKIVEWPLPGFSVLWLSGPSRDVALTDEFAYYASIRYAKDLQSPEPNELGGNFDLYRVALADGKSDRYPLSPECANPRVVAFAGAPVVYSWNGSRVWVFDPGASPLEALALRDVADEPSATRPGYHFADYAVIPDVGVFRVSRASVLTQVLDARLQSIGARTTLDLSPRGTVIRIIPAGLGNRPAVGVLIKTESELRYVAVDPASLKVLGELALPQHAVIDSIAVARDGSITYVDQQAATIGRIVEGRVETLWTLEKGRSSERHYHTRVLSLEP
jgi:hypothetical protein